MRHHHENNDHEHAHHGDEHPHHGRGAHGHHPHEIPDFTISQSDSPEDALLVRLRLCGHILRRRTEGKGSQRRILSILNKHNPITQRALMDLLHVQSGSMSEILGKIEGNRWIERRQNDQDKRHVDILLTDEGRIAMTQMDEQHAQAASALFAALSHDEIGQLSALLDKLIKAWQEQDEHKHSRRDERF